MISGWSRVAFEEGDEHFHADSRDGDAAVGVAGPAGGDAQPAAGGVVALAVAVPVELHFDPAVFVAVDFFARGAGDEGGLAAQHFGFRVFQGRAVMRVPRRGEEAVAVALVEVILVVGDVAGDVLAEYLRLLAFVDDFQQ